MKTVYLAGPISGLSYSGSTDWREKAIHQLQDKGIVGLSPMRYKSYLGSEETIQDHYADSDLHKLAPVLSSPRGITTRDRWDCMRCDAIIVNLLGAEKVSIGTVMEIAWADSCRKPIILIMEPKGNIHEHAIINECAGFRVTSLKDAISVASALLV